MRCPKVELHCHLFGTVRRATFTDLVRREAAPISDAEIAAFYTRGDKPVGVLRVLRALDTQLIRQPDDLHRLTLRVSAGCQRPQRALCRVLLESHRHRA